MVDRSMGGLRIGSLSAGNLGLLEKWWWRFHTEPDALWRQVISSINGSCGGFNSNRDYIKSSRLWINILKAGQKINDISVPFINSFKHKNCILQQCVSASSENRDLWRRDLFLGREMEELENFDSVIIGLSLQDGVDGWTWSLDTSGSFKVSILRSCIDSLDLSRSDPATLWNELIPKKVNVFFWRFIRNRLPTKTNLVDKGIDLHTVLCSFWDDYCESSDHIFIECKMVKPIWDSISRCAMSMFL
ncbi:RNA-directed DNA polymerase, eukaryota, reverse transcriptase zinc-binding domain protein [Tanacetum coccineum]